MSAIDAIARDYVKLVLAVGRHDPDYVDAYYGPPEWREQIERGDPRPLVDLAAETAALRVRLATAANDDGNERWANLDGQLRAMQAHCARLVGHPLSFDEEAAEIYQVRPPRHCAQHFETQLAALDRLLPGDGTVQDRYLRYRERFLVAKDRLDAVFTVAIAEARARTQRHLELPAGEHFDVEYVTGQPWSGYNWFRGGAYSLIQVNTDLPVVIDRALDLAAHEGYPGHHVYNSLLERDVLRARGWVEVCVYPLFSPQSLVAEGTANFGIDVAFPGESRTRFERDVLFPIAGLDAGEAERYAAVRELAKGLAFARNEAARDYLDGRIDAAAAQAYLERYALMTPGHAAQRVRFFDAYRAYVVAYNVGEEMVRAWVERQGGTQDRPEQRWEVFSRLLTRLVTPGDLEQDGR